MFLSPLDEYPIHQAPVPISAPATSDRNFYDRSYFNVLDRDGRFMMLTGIGYYPRLGVKDAYVLIRRGDTQTAVRFSDAIDDDRLNQNVNGYRLDVVEPLQELHLTVAETEGVSVDLRWRGLFPAALEHPHSHALRTTSDVAGLPFCPARHVGGVDRRRRRPADRRLRRPRWAAATGRGASGPSASRSRPAGRTPRSAECGGCTCRWPSTTTRSS